MMNLSKASSIILLFRAPGLCRGFSPALAGHISVFWIMQQNPSAAGIRSYQSTLPRYAIVDEVTDEMKTAMKAKDTAKLQTVRLIRSAFANAAIDLKTEKLSDEQAITVLKKMAKMRQESIEMFAEGGAEDRADAERAELAIIERWLPEAASEEQVREWVQEAIAEAGSDNMGKVMGALMKKHKADVDGKMAQQIVKEELAKQ